MLDRMREGTPFGAYRLLSLLGRGGMGETWRAVRIDAHGVTKEVALKRILRQVSSTPRFVEAFVAEARVCSQLSHGNIAQLFEFGQVGDEYFMALELVQGRSVRAVLDRAEERGLRGLPPELAVYVAIEALKGLQHAHTKKSSDGQPLNVIHRDLSPENLMLSWEGEVKLIDFGLAKAKVAGRSETAIGVLKGKPLYFAPEQARGEVLTPAADVWALGVVLHFMLAGRLPIDRVSTGEALDRLSAGESPSLARAAPHLPASLVAVVDRARAARREDRFPSALAFQQALAPVLRELAPDASQLLVSGTLGWLFARELAEQGRTVVVPRDVGERVERHRTRAGSSERSLAPTVPEGLPLVHQDESSGEGVPTLPLRPVLKVEVAAPDLPAPQPVSTLRLKRGKPGWVDALGAFFFGKGSWLRLGVALVVLLGGAAWSLSVLLGPSTATLLVSLPDGPLNPRFRLDDLNQPLTPQPSGPAAYAFVVPTGYRLIRVDAPGYRTSSYFVNVQAGPQPTRIVIPMRKQTGGPAPTPSLPEPAPPAPRFEAPDPPVPSTSTDHILTGQATASWRGVTVENETEVPWHDCELRLPNGKFAAFATDRAMGPHEELRLSPSEFHSDQHPADPILASGRWAALICREGSGYLRYEN